MEGRAAHVSSDAFFQALPVLWEYLGPRMQTKKDIRATCSGARLQHDRLLSHLHITLGRSPGMGKKRTKEIPPPPFFLWKVLQSNGGELVAAPSVHRLAVLHACSPCHVSRLELRGAVPHSSVSRATAEAVQACCPHLTSLNLDHMIASGNGSHYEAVPPREAASGYHDGCVQLLTLCGPRLTYLRLHGVHHWQPPSYMAVRHCTALTWLDFEAKHTNDKSGDVVVEDQIAVEPPTLELHVFSAVEHRKTLRSLSIATDMDPSPRPWRASAPSPPSPAYTCSYPAATWIAVTAGTRRTRKVTAMTPSKGCGRHTWRRWCPLCAACRSCSTLPAPGSLSGPRT